jgi:hypothetical protein
MKRNLGQLLLAIFLILIGINSLGLGITIAPIITGVIALVAGILLLMGK